VNGVVLLGATAVLSLTPAYVPPPFSVGDVVVILVGLGAMIVANGVLLGLSFLPLRRLVGLMSTVDLLQPQRLPATGSSEVRSLIETFNEMLDRLEAERQTSTRRVLMTQEQERRRIGQELHDEIGQRLTGVLLQLNQVVTAAPANLRANLREVQDAARAALDEVGRIAWQLRPGVLDDLGLVPALDALVMTFEEQTGVVVSRRIEEDLRELAPEVELAVYRIAQESLTNIARHAEASAADLHFEQHDGTLRLRITDNGRGLTTAEHAGSGIRGMRERALLIGARLQVESAPGKGVSVCLHVAGK
jgi:two-component system sensor histidine kinase UhpB